MSKEAAGTQIASGEMQLAIHRVEICGFGSGGEPERSHSQVSTAQQFSQQSKTKTALTGTRAINRDFSSVHSGIKVTSPNRKATTASRGQKPRRRNGPE